jgi:hypothetical protein
VLAAVTLVFVWHPDSRRHCRELTDEADEAVPADDATS